MKVMNKILLKCLIRTPRKSKNIKGNHKPYYNNNLRKAIMKISKSKCFKEVPNTGNERPFWETCESYFSNKHTHQDSKIMLFTEK